MRSRDESDGSPNERGQGVSQQGVDTRVHNVRVGAHAREVTAEAPAAAVPPIRRRLLLLAMFLTLSVVAWGVLVLAAIDFGGEARRGDSVAWAFLALSTLGAVGCLFVALLLGGRIRSVLKGGGPVRPRPRGGRRAAR